MAIPESSADYICTHNSAEQAAWEQTVDWSKMGPRLLAALETIDWAISSLPPAKGVKKTDAIISQVFKEIGRDDYEKGIALTRETPADLNAR